MTGRAAARPSASVRLALALAASTAIVAGSPLVGALRQALLIHWPAGYVPVLAAGVILPAIGFLVLCLRAVLSRRGDAASSWSRWNVAAIALAFGLAIAVGYLERTGDVNVDVVEAFHFVEFAALTCLFAWAVAPIAPGQAWVWGAAGSIVVGALDEWTQWFVPNRTGEIRDVGIDAVATVCGVLIALALGIGGRTDVRRLARPLAVAGAGTILVVAACFAVIHLGSVVQDAGAGRFHTRFNGPALLELARVRARQWGRGPIPAQGLFAREDQYLSEALWHVRRRNRAMEAGDVVAAYREQRILEAYYAPVLQVATADRAAGHALSAGQLEEIARGRSRAASGTSDASPIPIVTWSRGAFWTAVAGIVGVLAAVAVLGGPRRQVRAAQSIQPPPTTTSPS